MADMKKVYYELLTCNSASHFFKTITLRTIQTSTGSKRVSPYYDVEQQWEMSKLFSPREGRSIFKEGTIENKQAIDCSFHFVVGF